MEKITYKAIRERIQSAAHELTPDLPKENTLEAWEDFAAETEYFKDSEAYDKAFEEVSNWDWCIYTYKGFQVYDALSGSEQRDAEDMFEEMCGYETAAEQHMGPYEMGCHMAMIWLAQQVSGVIQETCEELLELANDQILNLEG